MTLARSSPRIGGITTTMTTSDARPDPIARLREICLDFPEATEKSFGGHSAPSFRVRDKLFVMTSENGTHMTCKAPPGDQAMLVASDPDRYFVPAYVGSKGWVGIHLDPGLDWDEISEIAEESYRMIAPKKLIAELDKRQATPGIATQRRRSAPPEKHS
jgi:predicted DNA-binding protein (MmcQ/YjbR family)